MILWVERIALESTAKLLHQSLQLGDSPIHRIVLFPVVVAFYRIVLSV
jgi:hypothetical protein